MSSRELYATMEAGLHNASLSTHNGEHDESVPAKRNSSIGKDGLNCFGRFRRYKLPQVCILILTHNSLEYIDKCVNSFLKQDSSLLDYELLVIDNKSSDGTVRHLLDSFDNNPRVRVIPLEKNYGFGSGFMRGLEIAKPDAKYLAFSNADLFTEQNTLTEILRVFEHHSSVGIVSPVVCNYDDENTIQVAGTYLANKYVLPLTVPYATKRDYRAYSQTHKEPYPVACPSGPLFVCESHVFHKIGGFDPEFLIYGEELDLGLRTWLAGSRVLIAPNARVYHALSHSTRSSPKTLRRRRFIFFYHRNMLRSLIKCVPARNFFPVIPLSYLYLFCYALAEAFVLRDSMIIAMHARALKWNVKNIRNTLMYRRASESSIFTDLQSVVTPGLIKELYTIAGIAMDQA